MPFNKNVFGARLRGKRGELDISQGELAERSGISLASINQYENEGYVPGADKICALALALGTDPNYLMGWDN